MAVGRVGGEFHVPASLATGNESLNTGFAQKCHGLLEEELNILFPPRIKLRFLGPPYSLYSSPLRTMSYQFSKVTHYVA